VEWVADMVVAVGQAVLAVGVAVAVILAAAEHLVIGSGDW
jgi:hypothetical protein